MAKTIQNLVSEVDASITSNHNAEITGPILNGVLKSLVGNLSNYFLFPLETGVTTGDIGKLMMNDGSGTAKVYQLSAATAEQKGRFVLKLEDLNDLGSDSMITIFSLNYDVSFNRSTWRNGSTPSTALEELQLIKAYIDANTEMDNLITSIVSGELVIVEDEYDLTQIELANFPGFSLFIDTVSRPALPATPTAFPIGKLIGIDGTNGLISTNAVETYLLDGTATINHTLFNNDTDIDFNDVNDLTALAGMLVVPSGDGKVKSLDPSEINFDETFISSFRHHIVGLALSSTSNSITVANTNHLSFLGHILKRIAAKGIFSN